MHLPGRDWRSEGELGEIYYARARSVRRSGIPAWNLGFIQKGGGAFRDMGVHVLDAVWWLLGMPKPVERHGRGGAKFGPRGQGYWKYAPVPEEYYEPVRRRRLRGGFIRFDNGAGPAGGELLGLAPAGEIQIELFGTEAGAKLHPLTIYRTVNGAPQDIVELTCPRHRMPWTSSPRTSSSASWTACRARRRCATG